MFIYNKTKHTFIFLLMLILAGCQEVYEPENLDHDDKIPVINGFVNNEKGPYMVELTWASPFNENQNDPIKNARVMIKDNNKNMWLLEEKRNGKYLSDPSEFQGIIGNTYQLVVELDNGLIIESEPAVMNNIPEIDSIYAEIGTKPYIRRSVYGEILTQEQKGLFLYTDLLELKENSRFFRIETKVVAQQTYVRNPSSIFPVYVYCWNVGKKDNLPNIKQGIFDGSTYQIRKKDIGFLSYSVDWSNRTDTSSAKVPAGWIVSVTLYSIQPKAFMFYSLVNEQLTADKKIFDPIPSQITGNLKCITDTTRSVLGIFEVASKVTRHKGFHWATGNMEYRSIDLPGYDGPFGGFGCEDTIPPDYWVHLYQFN